MRLTIIKEDGLVKKNGVVYVDLELSDLPNTFKALQWYETYGDLEGVDSNNAPTNTTITDISAYQWCIDKWQEAYDAEQAKIAAEAAAAAEVAAAEAAAESDETSPE